MSTNIEQQINDELEKFKNEKYSGSVEIPSDILSLFRRGVLSLAPQSHGILASKLKDLYTRNVSEITNGELSDIIKIIVNTPLDKLYEDEDFFGALDRQQKLEKFILCYNRHVDDFQSKLKMKRATLQSLANGVNGGMNGMRILKN